MARLALPVLTLALLGVLASPAYGRADVTVVAKRTLPIRSGQLETVSVNCPRGHVATGGSTAPLPLDVKLLKSAGTGPRRIFLFEPAGYGATEVVLVVTCKPKVLVVRRGGRQLVVRVRVAKVQGPSLRVDPGETEKSRLRCPSGMAPAGHGFEVTPAGGGGSVRLAQGGSTQPFLQPRQKSPFRGGFAFGVDNVDGPPANVRMSIHCQSRTGRGRLNRQRVTTPVRITRSIDEESIPPGAHGLERKCSRGRTPLEAGFNIPDGSPLRRIASHPNDKRGFNWLIVNPTDRPQPMTLILLCGEGRQEILRR
jgi:hypothetical protein